MMIGFLGALIIAIVIVWAVQKLLPLLGLPEPIAQVISVVVIVVIVIYLIQSLLLVSSAPPIWWWGHR